MMILNPRGQIGNRQMKAIPMITPHISKVVRLLLVAIMKEKKQFSSKSYF